jgi:hypothetical protein
MECFNVGSPEACRWPCHAPKAFHRTVHSKRTLSPLDIRDLNRNSNLGNGVLVVENVNQEWYTALVNVLGIDRSFFAEHASNPIGSTPWRAVFGDWSADHWKPFKNGRGLTTSIQDCDSSKVLRGSWHVDGVLEYGNSTQGRHARLEVLNTNFVHRPIAFDEEYGWSSGTRISYILVRPDLCGLST